MKVAMIIAIARQVEGEMCFVNVIKAHTDPNKLRQHLNENDLPRTDTFGEVGCVIEYGVIENIEVEED